MEQLVEILQKFVSECKPGEIIERIVRYGDNNDNKSTIVAVIKTPEKKSESRSITIPTKECDTLPPYKSITIGMGTRDANTKLKFVLYMLNHPDERFFQTIRNFSGYPFIGYSLDGEHYQDTFYLEQDEKQ